ncbi:MAG: hypothetical protein FJ121_12640 [Deltaproteobacteria bacterium]|nr:hypothetical protein [Deltaproteobacteria bacterium]
MKKKMCVLGVAALMAALLAMSGVAQSAMWVGAQLGGNFPLSTNLDINVPGVATARVTNVDLQPSVIGGAIIGYDFVNSGFGAYAWPDWMKYFSFATDFTYNRLSVRGDQTVGFTFNNVNFGRHNSPFPNLRLDGYQLTWAFLFRAQYGFMPDSETPGGRINPYIGIGPAILFSGFQGNTAVNVALVVEPGIRWMCFKNVSVDTAMRYRYAQPSWDSDILNTNFTVKANPLHQLSFLVRANLHF